MDEASPSSRLAAMRRMVGNTPLLAVRLRDHGDGGRERVLYAKQETANFTGSIKDRMALHILEEAYRDGSIRPGDAIVEATSGNTGIAFAGLGRALGHPVRILMPDWMSRERVLVIQSMGAEVVPVSQAEGGFLGSIVQAEEHAATHDHVFLPQQFGNEANLRAHAATTGPEVLAQLASEGLEPTAFVAGVGTGGTVMGVASFLRERAPAATVHPLEPANSPTLRTGCKVGKHRIQGISDEFIPGIVDLDALDEIVDVDDGDAILMAQALARTLGLAVGISSGANLIGALRVARRQGPDAVVATVLPDCNRKYLSTDYCCEEPLQEGFLSPQVELLDFAVIEPPCLDCRYKVEALVAPAAHGRVDV